MPQEMLLVSDSDRMLVCELEVYATSISLSPEREGFFCQKYCFNLVFDDLFSFIYVLQRQAHKAGKYNAQITTSNLYHNKKQRTQAVF